MNENENKNTNIPQPDEDGNIWFPFPTAQYEVSEKNVIDLSYFNQNMRSKIIIENGHFVDEKTHERVRFFGTNVCFADAFPSKEDSPTLAKRMSQLGINLVRFHHMDNRDIWLDKSNSILNPTKLDLLHYFLFCLHENGIYANINFHVSREYPEEEFTAEINKVFRYGKGLDRFYPPFIRDQIQYALNLLNSYNKYMKCKLGEDPMILNFELNNENSMFDLLRTEKFAMIKGTVFEKELQHQWHLYLREKYQNFDEIEKLWIIERDKIDRNNELLMNLTSGHQKDKNSTFSVDKKEESPAFYFSVNQKPQYTWSNQIHFHRFPLEKSTSYTIEFEAMAVAKQDEKNQLSVGVNFQEAKPPYKAYAVNRQNIILTNQYKKYSVVLTSIDSVETEDKTSYIICKFIISPNLGDYSFKNIKAYCGKENIQFWKGDRKIENILIPELSSFPPKSISDYRLFIQTTEMKTQNKITNTIKSLFPDCNFLIVDSQASYGNALSYEREFENSSFLDNHSYWQHPMFDSGFSWHRDHYSITNTPMFNSPTFGTFSRLKMIKPFGKPYTISEYNHPFPNDHLHEKFPMFGSWAAFHDWDAIYQFSYDQGSRNQKHIGGYFSMATNPIDFALAPLLAFAFRKYYVSISKNFVHLKIPKSYIHFKNENGNVYCSDLFKPFHAGWPSTFDVEIIDDLQSNKVGQIQCETNIDVNQKGQFITDEIVWKDTYEVKTKKLRSITGWIGNSTMSIENDLGIIKMKLKLNEKLNESATIAVVSLDDKELEKSEKILLVITGKVKNTNQKWNKERKSTGRTNEGANWGGQPTLVQFIEFEGILILSEKNQPKIWTINNLGEKKDLLDLKEIEQTKWGFKSDYSKPSLSFVIERTV